MAYAPKGMTKGAIKDRDFTEWEEPSEEEVLAAFAAFDIDNSGGTSASTSTTHTHTHTHTHTPHPHQTSTQPR